MSSKDISRFLDVPQVANRLIPIQENIDFAATRAKTNFCVLTALGLLSLGGGAALLTLLLTGGVGSDLSWIAMGSGLGLTVIGSGFLLSMCYLVAHRVCDVRDLREDLIQNSFITLEELLDYFTTAESPAIALKLSQLDLEEFPSFVDAIKDLEFKQEIVEAIARSSYERGLALPQELLAALIEGSSIAILLGLIDSAPEEDQQQILNELTEHAKSSYQQDEKVSKEHLEKLTQLCSVDTLIELIEYAHTQEEDQARIVTALESRAMTVEQGQNLPLALLDALCHLSSLAFLTALNGIATQEDKKRILKTIAHKTYDKQKNLPSELLNELIDVCSIETLIDLIAFTPKEGADRQRIAEALENDAMNTNQEQDLPPGLLDKLFQYSSVEFLITLLEKVSEKDKKEILEYIYDEVIQSDLTRISLENFKKLLSHTSIEKLITFCKKLKPDYNERSVNEFKSKTAEMLQKELALSDALMRLYDDVSLEKNHRKIIKVFQARLVNKLRLKIKLEEYVSVEALSKYLRLSSIEVIVRLFPDISLEDNQKPFLEELERRAMESYKDGEAVSSEHLKILLEESSTETLSNLMNCASETDRVSILAQVAKRTYHLGQNLEENLLQELIEKTPNQALELLRNLAPIEDKGKIDHALLRRELGISEEKLEKEEGAQHKEVKDKEKEKVEKEEDRQPKQEVETVNNVSFNDSSVLNIKILERASLYSKNLLIENLVSTED